MPPLISFAIASYNSAAFLDQAIASALAQRGVAVEVIVVDDHSSDDSLALARRWAESDARVRALQTERNLGPGGARNVALAAARGRWFAVLDSDDLLHPARSEHLLAHAEATGAEMVADDLLLFDDARQQPPSLFLRGARAEAPSLIDLPGYFGETRMYARAPNLGFLKPMIRTDFLRRHAIAYDPALRVAEDDALVIACLRAGARYALLPQPLYFYRKHGASITHRLATRHIDAMHAADRALVASFAASDPAYPALRARSRAMTAAWAYNHLIDALKARRAGTAAALVLRHPGALPLLRLVLAGRLARLTARPAAAPAPAGGVAIISRQRLTGATNGSSAYLIAIAGALRDAGLSCHLIQPSPSLFGRRPFFTLSQEMDVFASIAIRGARRWRNRVIATDPRIYARAALGIASRFARRAGVTAAWTRERKAPYAIATPWLREDRLFVAAHAPAAPVLALADYMFQAEGLPYLLAPAAKTGIVMHDLFHARAGQFGAGGDSVDQVDRAREVALLGAARAVLTIQESENAFVREALPAVRAINVPMPARTVAAPAPGRADRLLFVGSNTAPNVLGLGWFLDEVWPRLRAARGDVVLEVAGSVRDAMGAPPDGVRYLGLVPDLAGLYQAAGVVISPLRQGSGLKIKLVEALAQGKAVVATRCTLQGVEGLADEGAVIEADAADDFADAILRLLGDDAARAALAAAGLAAAGRHFGPARCFAELLSWVREA